jgi:hypothetical protein
MKSSIFGTKFHHSKDNVQCFGAPFTDVNAISFLVLVGGKQQLKTIGIYQKYLRKIS